MKFNAQLKEELKRYEKDILHPQRVPETGNPAIQVREPITEKRDRQAEKVAGGDIIWKPIDRAAAMLLAKAPWWAKPVDTPSPKVGPEPKPKKPKRKRTHMKGEIKEDGGIAFESNIPVNGEYVSKAGLRIKMVNGEAYFREDDIDNLLIDRISKLPMETRSNVLAAQDARKIIAELLNGIGSEMEKFNSNTKKYLEDIRQTRFAVVSETASMTKELKDVRQFFLGNDYNEQITRLREFVDLCERLQKLKQSGFLDSVADTMLRLA